VPTAPEQPQPLVPDVTRRRAAGGVVLRAGVTSGTDAGVGSAVTTDVLVVHRSAYDDWSLPKGHVDDGESDERTAVREVLEETGVDAEVVEDLGLTEHPIPGGTKVVHWFGMRARSGDPSLRPPDAEVDVARWLPVDEALARLTYANERDLLARLAGAAPRPTVDVARARYRREVGEEHVGARVSIRCLVDGVDGPQVTDRVGRLLSHEPDGLLLVDRHRTLHVVDPASIVASRLVPEHPRFEPEPYGDDRARAIERDAARVLLLDPDGRTLLVAHRPAPDRTVWTAPGGGLDPGESHLDAARRELAEEIGITPAIGPWIWSRSATFTFRGVWLHQVERWFLARVEDAASVDPAHVPLHDLATDGVRWWTVEDLARLGGDSGDEALAPRALAEHLHRLLTDGPPPAPIDVGR
jgi:8-oxo-dGTP pyrophosphatase MutT (NUDIX family)